MNAGDPIPVVSGSCSSGSCSSGSCSSGSCSSSSEAKLPPGMLRAYDINRPTVDGFLIWAETLTVDGVAVLHPSVPEIIGKAREINGGRMYAAIIGGSNLRAVYDELFSYGIESLYHIRSDDLDTYDPKAYAYAIVDLTERINPAAMLLLGTPKGREVAPIVAAKLHTGLTADCTDLGVDEDGNLVMRRPAFGGNLLATVMCDTFPQMATVRPGVFPRPEPEIGRKGTVFSRPFRFDGMVRVATDIVAEAKGIGSYDVLISVGSGIRDRDTIEKAAEVARILGAGLSCSRPIAEKGWLPRSVQVGQSGTIVSPKLYIAFGISGSAQHMAGVRAERIISVNTDRDAPINGFASVRIVEDADKVLAAMLDRLRTDGQ